MGADDTPVMPDEAPTEFIPGDPEWVETDCDYEMEDDGDAP